MSENIIELLQRQEKERAKLERQIQTLEDKLRDMTDEHRHKVEYAVTWTEKDKGDCADIDLSNIYANDIAKTVVFITGIRSDIPCVAIKTEKSGYVAAAGGRICFTFDRYFLIRFFAEAENE